MVQYISTSILQLFEPVLSCSILNAIILAELTGKTQQRTKYLWTDYMSRLILTQSASKTRQSQSSATTRVWYCLHGQTTAEAAEKCKAFCQPLWVPWCMKLQETMYCNADVHWFPAEFHRLRVLHCVTYGDLYFT